MADLLSLMMDLEHNSSTRGADAQVIRAPFPYPGNKRMSVNKILPYLPSSKRYVEVFGGSAAIMLNKYPTQSDVYNDRYGGIVSFYRCIRDQKFLDELLDRLELTVFSREEFVWCKKTWDTDVLDDVERAARWYYMLHASFGGLGRHFGRSTEKSQSQKIRNSLPMFQKLHDRFKNVTVENLDWETCMNEWDCPDTVFYLDPPYICKDMNIYTDRTMSYSDHRRLLEYVFSCEGFVALSGYPNELYDAYDWDDRIEWGVFCSMTPLNTSEGNGQNNMAERKKSTEVLWIKEAK